MLTLIVTGSIYIALTHSFYYYKSFIHIKHCEVILELFLNFKNNYFKI